MPPSKNPPLPSGPLNILLFGGGAREHALAAKLRASPRCAALYTTHPENPGLAALASPVDVPVNIREYYRLEQFCRKHQIHLAVIGPEDPLAEGFADKLRESGISVFGPGAEGAKIEADKAWAKQLLRGASVPQAESRTFTDPESARQYIESRAGDDPLLAPLFEAASRYRDPQDRRKFIEQEIWKNKDLAKAYAAKRPDLPVIKASGLAKGKGVVLPDSIAEAVETVHQFMVRRIHGDAGKALVLEERLSGTEVSLLAITDGTTILLLPPAQDHKRLNDHDTGPNTGGMGAFCPSTLLDSATLDKVEREILIPTVDALKREGIDYKGVLYAGLILTHAGPKVLEYNCRFGDPECQPIMARLRSDLLDLIVAACDGRLDQVDAQWDDSVACCVVLSSRGYPEKPATGFEITGIDEADALPGVCVTHAGTKRTPEGKIVTAGGRVLSVTALAPSLEAARAKAYAAADLIHFEGKHCRRDIGTAHLRKK